MATREITQCPQEIPTIEQLRSHTKNIWDIIQNRIERSTNEDLPLLSNEERLVFFKEAYRWLNRVPHTVPKAVKIFKFLVQECYIAMESNSNMVTVALKILADLHVDLIFLVRPNEVDTPAFLSRRTRNYQVQPLEFFLYHSNRERQSFSGYRLPNIDVFDGTWKCISEVAAKNSPKDLFLLLSYGALMKREEDVFYIQRHTRIIEAFIKKLILLNPTISCILLSNFSQEARNEIEVTIECLKWLQRIAPFRVMISTDLLNKARDPREQPKKVRLEELCNLILGVGMRAVDSVDEPMNLTHWCRLKIRKVLYDHWNLPSGIQALPLEEEKNYIRLIT